MAPRRPKLGALAVVLRDDRVILAQRRNPPDAHKWGYPGGHVELGETALAAAARELLEETGVVATPRQYISNADVIFRDATGEIAHHYLLAGVLCDYVSGEPAPASDVRAARWVSVDDVLAGRLPMSDRVPDLLRLALALV